MTLLRICLLLLTVSSLSATPAWADLAPEDTSAEAEEGGSDTADDGDDGGCATVHAAGALGAMGLGLALVIGLRRRED